MKRFLLLTLALLAGVLTASAATPSFLSFEQPGSGFRVVQPYIYVSGTNSGSTNIFINTTNIYNNSTIYITNSFLVISNSTVTINGTNVATINPTIGRLPYNGDGTNFFDSAISEVDDTTASVQNFDVVQLQVTNLIGGGVVYAATFGPSSGIVTNLPLAPGVLQSDGTTIFWNTSGDSLWTNSGGAYFPVATDQTALLATNITSVQTLTANGAFLLAYPNAPITLFAGENDISTTDRSVLVLASSDATAQLRLNTGNGPVEQLLLYHAGTTVFTLYNGDALYDDGTSHLFLSGGDWAPDTDGQSMLLFRTPVGWSEAARFGNSTNVLTQELWQFAGGYLQPKDLTQPLYWEEPVFWGPGTNNVMRGNGPQITWTSTNVAAGGVTLKTVNGNAKYAVVGIDQDENAAFAASAGGWVKLEPNNGSLSYAFNTSGFWPTSGNPTLGLDDAATVWGDFYHQGNDRIYGFYSDTNYSRLTISHPGTSGTIKIDSQSSGTGGTPRNVMFQKNGTNLVQIGSDGSLKPQIILSEPGTANTTTFTQTSSISEMLSSTEIILAVSGANQLQIDSSGYEFSGTAPNADFIGFRNGSGNSTLRLVHTGTNGLAIINSVGSGIAGSPRPLALQSGSTNMMQLDGLSGASTTGILIYENGTQQRVTIGVADSGGAGFRVLRIPN